MPISSVTAVQTRLPASTESQPSGAITRKATGG